MENITIGQIGGFLTFIVALIGSVEFLYYRIKKWFKTALNEELEPIKKNIQSAELQSCKNYLVVAIEKAKKEKYMSDAEKKRFYEVYDTYVNKYHQNSYIHNEVEDLKKQDIL